MTLCSPYSRSNDSTISRDSTDEELIGFVMERCLVDNIIYPDKEMIKVEDGYVNKKNFESYIQLIKRENGDR